MQRNKERQIDGKPKENDPPCRQPFWTETKKAIAASVIATAVINLGDKLAQIVTWLWAHVQVAITWRQ